MRRNCEHLASMINDVLDLSQIEAGRLALHKEWVDWHEVIERALVIVRPLLAKKGIALHLSIPDDLPRIYCDRTRIRQVILNLLSNATRFTDEGSITVTVRAESQYVVISVCDTGPGISAEDASRIFEPFQQGSFQQRRDQGGSGLGLSISKQFVELHGGRMWLQSEPGRGSTFSFRIPTSSPVDVSRRGPIVGSPATGRSAPRTRSRPTHGSSAGYWCATRRVSYCRALPLRPSRSNSSLFRT